MTQKKLFDKYIKAHKLGWINSPLINRHHRTKIRKLILQSGSYSFWSVGEVLEMVAKASQNIKFKYGGTVPENKYPGEIITPPKDGKVIQDFVITRMNEPPTRFSWLKKYIRL